MVSVIKRFTKKLKKNHSTLIFQHNFISKISCLALILNKFSQLQFESITNPIKRFILLHIQALKYATADLKKKFQKTFTISV